MDNEKNDPQILGLNVDTPNLPTPAVPARATPPVPATAKPFSPIQEAVRRFVDRR